MCHFWSMSVPCWALFFRWNFLSKIHPIKSWSPYWSPNNYDTEAIKVASLHLTHDAPQTAVISDAISYSLPISLLSFTRWVRSHSVNPSDIVGEAIWSLWGDLIQHTPRHYPHLPVVSRSLSASLRKTKEHVTAPGNAWSSHRLSFLCSSGFYLRVHKTERAVPWSVCSWNPFNLSRVAAHTNNYTLRHKMRYSGKKLSPFFLSNSFMCIETHKEIDYIHLSYTYTGSLFYLKNVFCHLLSLSRRSCGGSREGLR